MLVTSRSSLADLMNSEARGAVLTNIVDISKKLGIKPNDIVTYIGKL
jgi:DNA-binding Xre family transcriptional regulator